MRVEVGGLHIAYERAGAGPPVILGHGFVGDARSTWLRQIEALAEEFTVVAWDAPGAGGSDDPPDDFGMDDYADCLAGFVRTLGLGPAGLVGFSFGAALVVAAFRRHAGLAYSLALVGGYAGWLGSLGPEAAQQRLSRSLEASHLPPDQFAELMVPTMFSPAADPEQISDFVDSVRNFHPRGFRAMSRACYEDQSAVLPEIDVPMLLIYGDHDTRAPVAVGEAIHAAVEASELVVLPGPGHVSSVEAPDEVTAELRRFLRATIAR